MSRFHEHGDHTDLSSLDDMTDVMHALDLIDEGFAVFDSDLKLLASNLRFHDFLGYPRELREPGTSLSELYRFRAKRGDFGAGVVEDHVKTWCGRARRIDAQEYEQRRASGVVIAERFQPLSKHGVLVTVADVTAVKELRNAEEKIRQLARLPEENPNPVLRFTADDKIMYANNAAAPLMSRIKRVVGDDAPDEWRQMFSGLRAAGAVAEHEYTREGATYSLLLFPVEGTGMVNMYGRDITGWKEAERALRSAKEEADQANQTKSQFLATMSHELRTPMNAIIGFTRIVMRKTKQVIPEKQLGNLKKILVSAEHLLALINNILDLSKIEAGRMDVTPEQFDIGALAELCLRTVEPMLREGVEIFGDVGDVPPIYTDKGKLKQIVINLLSNAVKFTKAGSVTLRVRADGDQVSLAVVDTGIGIPEDSLATVFDEFKQVDGTATREYGGTGLGLAITRHLSRLLGGGISATSKVGEGSTFQIVIPIRYTEAGDEAAPRPEVPSPSPAANGEKVILVIDDDPNAIDLVTENLSEAGYRVVGAHSGTDGLAKARALRPTAITLDVVMSSVDGWQVLHQLKQDPVTRDIPVIMLSVVDQKQLGYRLGASDYLVKPIEREALIAAVGRMLPKRGKLLVVDDDPNVHDLVSQLLENESYQVLGAADGVQGLAAIREHRPDAVFLDLMMPELDGFGVLHEMQNDPELRSIPVVIVTAKTLSAEEKTQLEQRALGIVKKQGLDRDALLNELRSVVPGIDRQQGDAA